jgi:hypothetical protein
MSVKLAKYMFASVGVFINKLLAVFKAFNTFASFKACIRVLLVMLSIEILSKYL